MSIEEFYLYVQDNIRRPNTSLLEFYLELIRVSESVIIYFPNVSFPWVACQKWQPLGTCFSEACDTHIQWTRSRSSGQPSAYQYTGEFALFDLDLNLKSLSRRCVTVGIIRISGPASTKEFDDASEAGRSLDLGLSLSALQ